MPFPYEQLESSLEMERLQTDLSMINLDQALGSFGLL
jgi:hypothetical protein